MKRTLMILLAGLVLACCAAQGFAAWEPGVQIHGFISQGFVSTTENNFIADSENGTFEFNEVGINFGRRLTSRLHLGMQLFSRDFGDTGNQEIKIDWALIDYRIWDWLGVRMGQLKAPHGFYNEYRDVDTLRTFIFLPQSIYPEITRDVTLSVQGGGLYGLIDMYSAGRLSYQFLCGTQSIDPDNDRLSEALGEIPQSFIDNETVEVDVKYVGSLNYETPLPGLRLGVSYDNVEMTLAGRYNRELNPQLPAGSPVTMEFDTNENWVYSLEYTLPDMVLMVEYMDTYRKFNTIISDLTSRAGEFEQTGWYLSGTYRLTDWFELGAYYSTTEAETNADLGSFSLPDFYDELTDICGTLRFDINENWLLKLEYHTLTGAKGLSVRDNPSSSSDSFIPTDNFEKEWTMFAAKLTIVF